jgi:leucine-rich repeat protein SHOC2
MDDLNAGLCTLPVDLRAIVLSNVEHVRTRQILARSSTFQEAFSLPGALPRTFDFEGVAGDDIADHLVRLLDDDRVRSLEKERALELIGVHQDRLCEYACVQRNFEVLKWARNELDLPWAQYPAEPVSDDVLVLRMLRATWPELQERWPEAARPEDWEGVTMDHGRVVKLELRDRSYLTGAVPAEIGQLTSLRELDLYGNKLTSLPAEIGQLTSLRKLNLSGNQLTSLPAEIGQLTLLEVLDLRRNELTSLPTEIGQLTSLESLYLSDNKLTSLPAEIGQLTSLEGLGLGDNELTTLPAAIRELEAAGCHVCTDDGVTFDDDDDDVLALMTWRAMCPELQERWPEAARPEDWEGVTIENGRVVVLALEEFGLTGAVPAEIGRLSALRELELSDNQLTSLPAEIGQLTSLQVLYLADNQLTSLPAEIGQLTSLQVLYLADNQLTSLPAEIGQLTSLTWWLNLSDNQLTSLPAEIGQLTSMERLSLRGNQLTSVPAAIRDLRAAGCDVYLDDGVTFDE